MVSLVDIVPQKRTVQTSGGELELRGLGLRQIADLLLRFPTLRNLFVQGAPELEVETLLIMAPDAVSAIIAEAAGQPEAVDAIADGAVLTLDELTQCLAVVHDLTLPQGARPLLEWVTLLLGDRGGVGLSGKVPDTSSPPVPNGSLQPDTTHAT